MTPVEKAVAEPVVIDAGPRIVAWREILTALRVLSAEQYDAWVTADKIRAGGQREGEELKAKAAREAAEIIARARSDADKIKADALREAEHLQELAQQNGYQAGQEAALKEGMKVNDTWARIGDTYNAQLEALTGKEEAQIVTFASLLAQRIVRNALADPSVFRDHLKNLLQEDSGKPVLLIHAHPDQVEPIKRASSRFPNLAETIVEPDRTLEMGDLRLQYAWHKVDGRVQTMIGNGAAVLLQDILSEAPLEKGSR